MGLKEKLEERKERQEAINYFRQNNDAFMSPSRYLIITISAFLMAFVGALIQAVFTSGTGISFGLFYLVAAYLIAMSAKRTSTMVNDNVIMISMVAYVLMIVLSKLFLVWLPMFGFSHIFMALTNIKLWNMAFKMVITPNVFAWLSYIMGGIELYYLLR